MALVIRLARRGAKHRDFWRLVVADSRSPRDGRFVEMLGYYDPMTNPATIKVDTTRIAFWIGNGAKPSEKARAVINNAGAVAPVVAPVVTAAPVAAPAPVVEAPAPVVEAPAPVVEAPAPVVDAPAEVVAEPVAEAPVEPAAEAAAEPVAEA